MAPSFSKTLRSSSSLKMDEEAKLSEKKGIVSILGSDVVCERGKAGSLRRTLSADMSSKKWLAQHGFSPMKKIASSEQFLVSISDSSSSSSSSSSSEGEEEDYEEREELEKSGSQFDIWSSIQSEEKKKKETAKPGQFDIWSSFLAQKANEDSSKSIPLPPPYIHPLVKRSANSLSKKSLEICTESLGSETGSEGFSSYPPSEIGDIEEEREEEQQHEEEEEEEEKVSQPFDMEELPVGKYNCPYGKKSLPKSFPPPLPSLSRDNGESLHMRSHRKNGRLVLETVSVPLQNYFRAQREDGRLLLTFVSTPTSQEPNGEEMIEEDEKVFNEEYEKFGEEEEAEEDDIVKNVARENGTGIVIGQAPKLALMMNKLLRMANTNPTWSHKFNKGITYEEVEEEEEEEATPLPQSLPPQPRVGRLIPPLPPTTAAASFNAYEYSWRPTKPTAAAAILNPVTQKHLPLKTNNNNVLSLSKNPKAQEQQQQHLLKGNKADYLVPLLRSCKETRRSLLFWEPYCVATS